MTGDQRIRCGGIDPDSTSSLLRGASPQRGSPKALRFHAFPYEERDALSKCSGGAFVAKAGRELVPDLDRRPLQEEPGLTHQVEAGGDPARREEQAPPLQGRPRFSRQTGVVVNNRGFRVRPGFSRQIGLGGDPAVAAKARGADLQRHIHFFHHRISIRPPSGRFFTCGHSPLSLADTSNV